MSRAVNLLGASMPPVISDTTVFVDELANQTTGVSLIAEVRLVDGQWFGGAAHGGAHHPLHYGAWNGRKPLRR